MRSDSNFLFRGNMLDNTISDYYAGITDTGSVVFIDYLREGCWRAKYVSGQCEFLDNNGCTEINNSFVLKYTRPISIDELLNMKNFHTKIQWCYKEAESIRSGNHLIRGFSEESGVNYCIRLNQQFKFIISLEFNENILFTADSFEEAKLWCEQNVLEKLGYYET